MAARLTRAPDAVRRFAPTESGTNAPFVPTHATNAPFVPTHATNAPFVPTQFDPSTIESWRGTQDHPTGQVCSVGGPGMLLDMDATYIARATSSGDARNGHVKSDDGILDEDVRMPKEMGGAGGATNPEQLFAAGYAACFHQALKLAAGEEKVDVSGSTIDAQVGIGPDDTSFAIQVALTVSIPGADQATADKLAEKAHGICPYSKATRGNVQVDVTTSV